MSNPYYTFTPIGSFTRGKSPEVNARFQQIDAAFGQIPSPTILGAIAKPAVDAGGSANALTVANATPVTVPALGQKISFRATATSTGPATLNVDGTGATALRRFDGTATVASDLIAGRVYEVVFDGANWQLTSATPAQSSAFNTPVYSLGNRPAGLDGSVGRAFLKGDSGGWELCYTILGANSSVQGGFGALGAGSLVTYHYIGGTGFATAPFRFYPNGIILAGSSDTSGGHVFAAPAPQGDKALTIANSSAGLTAIFYGCGNIGWNAAAAAMKLGANNETGRSLNVAGTVNSGGADYAEYMRKSPGCGPIAKGDVCGIDANGELTREWSEAHSFVLKSGAGGIEPSYVGGDTWGVGLEGEAHEAARRAVDRIAFCGQAFANVSGPFAVGDYIVAAQDGFGIKAIAVAPEAMTLAQYFKRIGKVWAIGDNGLALVDVQHG